MSESSDALATLPEKKRTLADSLVSEITHKHKLGLELDDKIRESVKEKIALTIEVGQLLEEAKASFSPSQFAAIVAKLGFSQPCLRGYVKIASRARHEQDFRSHWKSLSQFQEAAKTTGLIEPVERKSPRLHVSNFFAVASRSLLTLLSLWKKYATARPIKHWELDEVEAFSYELKPLVDIYSELCKEIARRK